MLRRVLLGLVLGLVLGGLLATALVAGLKIEVFEGATGTFTAFFAAAVAGVLTGLVAGKPIWAADGKIEAGLKAVFGALIGAGAMYALRRWGVAWTIDLSALHAGGPAEVGALPAASLPLIAATLGALFELDNTEPKADKSSKVEKDKAQPRSRVSAQASRPSTSRDLDGEEGAGSSQDADFAGKRTRR